MRLVTSHIYASHRRAFFSAADAFLEVFILSTERTSRLTRFNNLLVSKSRLYDRVDAKTKNVS